jgi:hypothetical protein
MRVTVAGLTSWNWLDDEKLGLVSRSVISGFSIRVTSSHRIMSIVPQALLVSFIFVSLRFWLLPTAASDRSFDLRRVKGMEAFGGSKEARRILGNNGFVVADPSFKQIFEPYVKSPQIEPPSGRDWKGISLPSFITTDSAWHTYHVLLDEGLKELEERQSHNLLAFSHELWTAIRSEPNMVGQDRDDLALYTSVGLALQDETQGELHGPEVKRILGALKAGSSSVSIPIGFPLAPHTFRAEGFYTRSEHLSNYFAARQWYASIVFRLNDTRETRLALILATLVEKDPILKLRWIPLLLWECRRNTYRRLSLHIARPR